MRERYERKKEVIVKLIRNDWIWSYDVKQSEISQIHRKLKMCLKLISIIKQKCFNLLGFTKTRYITKQCSHNAERKKI